MDDVIIGRKMTSTKPRPSPVPSLWVVAGLLIAHQIALIVIHYGLVPAAGVDPRSAMATSMTIVGAAILVGLVIVIDARKPDRASAALLRQPSWDGRTWSTMAIGLALAQIPLAILALQGMTVWQAGQASNLEVGQALMASLSGPSGVGLLIATVLVAPIIEEVLYRGYLVGAIVRRVPALVAVVISAVLFVTLHFEPANLVASFCLGLGAALCAVRTGSVVPGLIVHVASNAFGMWYATLG